MAKKKAETKSEPSKADRLKQLLNDYRAKNPSSLIGMGDEAHIIERIEYEKIPTGADALDLLIDGGIPRGKVTVFCGRSSSGKSALAKAVIANYQALHPDQFVLIDDAENTLDKKWLEKSGVDLSRVIVIPGTKPMEDQMDEMIHFLNDAEKLIGLVLVDSIGSMTPRVEFAGKKEKRKKKDETKGEIDGFSMDADTMAVIARKLGQFCRVMGVHLARHNPACIIIAHVYQDISSTGGGAYVMKGGNALKHHSHLTLNFRPKPDDDFKENILCPDGQVRELRTGFYSIIKVEKTKQSGHQYAEIQLPFRLGMGFDTLSATVHSAVGYGVIQKSGSWFSFGGEKLGQGIKKVMDRLTTDPELRLKVRAELITAMQSAVMETAQGESGDRPEQEGETPPGEQIAL